MGVSGTMVDALNGWVDMEGTDLSKFSRAHLDHRVDFAPREVSTILFINSSEMYVTDDLKPVDWAN